MFNARRVVHGAALGGALVLGGCKGSQTSTSPASASEDAARAPAQAPAETPAQPPAPAGPKIQVHATISGVADMMTAAQQVWSRIDPDDAPDPQAALQASLLSLGFGPGFLRNIALDGTHVMAFGIPSDSGTDPRGLEIAGNAAVVDPRGVIEGMPQSYRPQPLGDGVWELKQQEMTFLFREAGDRLWVGLGADGLRRAESLQVQPEGKRIRVRAENLPTETIDLAEALSLGAIPLGEQVQAVLDELESLEVEAEFGTARDLELLTRAVAPFEKLGVEPLGQPRRAPTALESRLPADPMFATTLSWGDPRLLHETLDRTVPVDQIPEPFGKIVRAALLGVHGLLEQVDQDLVAAIYVDPKGSTSLVLAADVKDEAKMLEAMRGLNAALVDAARQYAVLQGKNEAGKFKIDHRPDGLTLSGGVKADRLTVTVPADFRSDFDPVEPFMRKDAIESVSFTTGRTAVVVIGATAPALAKSIAAGIAKPAKASLAQNQALATLRAAMEGCQVCVAFDARDYLRFRLQLITAEPDTDKAIAKEARDKLKELAKVEDIADLGAGLQVVPASAALAAFVPEELLFADPAVYETMRSINEFVDQQATASATTVAEAP